MAAAQKKPVGALVREWVLEKLAPEHAEPTPTDLMREIQQLRKENRSYLELISEKIRAISQD